MIRRCCGPLIGPMVFLLVAGLVFAGLGWVTVSALRVEESRGEAAVENEHGHNLRIALWRLDGRMLSPLSVEDNRPFHHYAGGDVPAIYGPGSAPLLDAPLPDWMLLHFQIDPDTGWSSPQVLSAAEVSMCRQNWRELTLRNVTTEKAAMLAELRAKFPVRHVTEWFAYRERSIPEDSPPSPLFLDNYNPPPEPLQPYVVDETRQLNLKLNPNPAPAQPASPPDANTTGSTVNPEYKAPLERFEKGAQQVASQPGSSLAPPPRPTEQQSFNVTPSGRSGNYRMNNELSNEYQKRADISRAASQDAKSALMFPLTQNSVGNGLNFNNPSSQTQGVGNGAVLNPANRPGFGGGGSTLATGQPTTLNPPVPGPTVPLPPTSGPGGPVSNFFFESAKDTERLKELKPGTTTSQEPGWFGRRDALRSYDVDSFKKAEESKTKFKDANDAKPRSEDCANEFCFLGLHLQVRRFRASVMDDRTGPLGNTVPGIVPAADGLAVVPTPLFDQPARPIMVHLGSMRPQWITAADGTDVLVFVRTARIDNRVVYQGVVVDWKKLEESLRDEVKDLFPEARLVAVKDPAGVSPERAMTALPVQLDPGPIPAGPPLGWTPLRLGLVLAWVAAFIAFAAVGYSRWSTLDLAERRIRFVSAVTHELRTPLTSLRLYLDLLLSGMVQDEEKRREYLATLNTESDRLHRLIDNVLDFARLEKKRKSTDSQPVRVADFLDQVRETWTERCGADDKELVVINTLPPDEKVNTDPHLVQQIVGNLIDNARKYTRDAADKRIWLFAKPGGRNRIVFEVEDRGSGVPVSERRTIFKPFRRGDAADTKAGGAGLGLALAKQWAELLGGRLNYRPADGGVGACFRLELRLG